ncbi:hypothetical protein ECC02_009822 [Trypanosoma cruzi]|uniref:Uncharacterized protein n=1 Tax=Trypanosoma cruzi TaxID=5693 RepID=A0A7J6XT10_TRYCR|nr:hypothetical protein ECC02_009822 [Trypanosoma cruzi]
MTRRQLAAVTAAPRSPTPPPLFCFFFLLLRVRLLLRWWPRESEGERAVHRPHTHPSFTHSLCVSPCMDSRPHLTPRSTHIMCPLYICMHTHAGPLVLSFARHAPLPSCLAAWAEHRNCFCFVFIALSGRPLSLSPCVCVLLYGSNESVCAGRPTPRLFVLFFLFFFFESLLVLWVHAPIALLLIGGLLCGRLIFFFAFLYGFSLVISVSAPCVFGKPPIALFHIHLASVGPRHPAACSASCAAVDVACDVICRRLPRCHPDVSLFSCRCGACRQRAATPVVVRVVRLRAQDASRVCSLACKRRWVSVPVKTSSTAPGGSRRHCGIFCCSTATLLDGAPDWQHLGRLWEKVGG